jgi:hypothetical protein
MTSLALAYRPEYPSILIIAFPRAAGLLYDGYAEATQADCIGLDPTVPIRWAAENIQRKLECCVQGNLGPIMLVAGGPANARSSPGHSIIPMTSCPTRRSSYPMQSVGSKVQWLFPATPKNPRE